MGKKKIAKKRGGGAINQHKKMAMGLKDGGPVGKKKQGYKDRKDESIAMRIREKRNKKQLKASRDDSYGRFGSKAKKSGKINKQFIMFKKWLDKIVEKLFGKRCKCND